MKWRRHLGRHSFRSPSTQIADPMEPPTCNFRAERWLRRVFSARCNGTSQLAQPRRHARACPDRYKEGGSDAAQFIIVFIRIISSVSRLGITTPTPARDIQTFSLPSAII